MNFIPAVVERWTTSSVPCTHIIVGKIAQFPPRLLFCVCVTNKMWCFFDIFCGCCIAITSIVAISIGAIAPWSICKNMTLSCHCWIAWFCETHEHNKIVANIQREIMMEIITLNKLRAKKISDSLAHTCTTFHSLHQKLNRTACSTFSHALTKKAPNAKERKKIIIKYLLA